MVESSALQHQELVRVGGKDQIPFLIDHRTGTKLYESAAIEQYLRHEYGETKAKYGLHDPSAPASLSELVMKQVRARLDRVERPVRSGVERMRWRLQLPLERLQNIRTSVWERFGVS